jgi:hypothetical protein
MLNLLNLAYLHCHLAIILYLLETDTEPLACVAGKLEASSAKSLSIRMKTQVVGCHLKAGINHIWETSLCRGSLAWLRAPDS